MQVCMCAKSLQSCLPLCYPMDHSQPGSSVMGFFKQEYWSGLPCPPPGTPDTGIKPGSPTNPALAGKFFTTSITWEAHACIHIQTIIRIDLWRWVGKQERRFVPFLFYLLCFTMSYINFIIKRSEKKVSIAILVSDNKNTHKRLLEIDTFL